MMILRNILYKLETSKTAKFHEIFKYFIWFESEYLWSFWWEQLCFNPNFLFISDQWSLCLVLVKALSVHWYSAGGGWCPMVQSVLHQAQINLVCEHSSAHRCNNSGQRQWAASFQARLPNISVPLLTIKQRLTSSKGARPWSYVRQCWK